MRKFSGSGYFKPTICGIACLAAISVALIGCYKSSPFTAALFNSNLPGVPAGGGGGGNGNGNDNTGTTVFDFLTDVPAGLRTIQSYTLNSAPFRVRQRKLFVVTAGAGGFVEDANTILDYLSAGYRDLIPPGSPIGTTTQIGCVRLRLSRGTRLLGKATGDLVGQADFIPANTSGDVNNPTGPVADVRTDNNDTNIPLPEYIVFATEDPNFTCVNPQQPCTQQAFKFFDANSAQEIGNAVTATKIQGTVCNVGLGQSPESRLDKTDDGMSSAFQYVPGAIIIWRVLDRQFDDLSNNRVQVVWTVADADGNVIHAEQP